MRRKPNRNIVCGIYTIINSIDKKIYIGYSNNIFKRWDSHKACLRKNNHKNQHLQYAWNKYGEENFEFEILEECLEKFLASQENYWCNLLNVHNDKYGYNIELTHPDKYKGKMSEQSLQKMKISLRDYYKNNPEVAKANGKFLGDFNRGKPLSEELKLKQKLGRQLKPRIYTREQILNISKPILQYDLKDSFIKEWESAKVVELQLNISRTGIHRALKNSKTAGGFKWKYKQ